MTLGVVYYHLPSANRFLSVQEAASAAEPESLSALLPLLRTEDDAIKIYLPAPLCLRIVLTRAAEGQFEFRIDTGLEACSYSKVINEPEIWWSLARIKSILADPLAMGFTQTDW